MGTTIRLPDGRVECIGKDSHFAQILLDHLGDDAARWFEDRIRPYDDIHELINSVFRDLSSERLFTEDLDKIGVHELRNLMCLLDELRGWDE